MTQTAQHILQQSQHLKKSFQCMADTLATKIFTAENTACRLSLQGQYTVHDLVLYTDTLSAESLTDVLQQCLDQYHSFELRQLEELDTLFEKEIEA